MTRDTDAKHVRLLLCSHLGLPRGSAEKPLSVGEYTQLENAVDAAGVCDIANLPAHGADELAVLLGVPLPLVERIAHLLSRSAQVAAEVEHLESRGMWTLTRGDADYPQRWQTVLGGRAPVVLYGSGDRKLLRERCIAIVGSRNV